ncbi:hypothetical protein CC80DRAFT_533512 [Byssothecium circinans]|uniref:Uncharacterized protein n=1 Tax=Byssothecium circinans TaxID=147558 RepID=A0A6A5U928_9PLEO|nr:hypothetical protein CC80DRAFT_533512 [Byssothecium circinans]
MHPRYPSAIQKPTLIRLIIAILGISLSQALFCMRVRCVGWESPPPHNSSGWAGSRVIYHTFLSALASASLQVHPFRQHHTALMENLPLVVLQEICEYVSNFEPKRSSLWALASTSGTCYAATGRERFSRVLLSVGNEEQFEGDLLRLDHLLETQNSRRYIRCLRICAQKVNADDDDGNDGTEDPFSIPPTSRVEFYKGEVHGTYTPDESRRRRDSWEQLARFVSGLALQDLIWASPAQVPACVLTTLHEHNPNCRLHVQTFCLRSLHQADGQQNIEDSEYILATSPCLYSIIGPYSPYSPAGRVDYNEEAIRQMVAGSAPRLSHVHVWFQRVGASGELRSWRRKERPPWRGFHPQSTDETLERPQTKGRLKSLTIDPGSRIDESQFAAWEAHTNFSYLCSLKLMRFVDLEMLERLADLAENRGFGRLRALDLPAGSSRAEFRVEIDRAMQRLLLALPPLESLSIEAIGDTPFDAALEQHGASLQYLHVKDSILYSQQITQLRSSCTNIRHLGIEMLRTGGDKEELRIYRTLGAIRSLEKLTLELQCTAYRHPDGPDDPVLMLMPFGGEEDQEEMRASIRDVLINAAIDEILAHAIFEEIMGGNTAAHGTLPPKLSRVKLKMDGATSLNGQSMSQDFQGILRWIGRHWVCGRDPRDTHYDQTIVKEVGRQERVRTGNMMEDDMDELSGSEQYGDVWRALWPETGRGWREEWRSFPLDNGCAE